MLSFYAGRFADFTVKTDALLLFFFKIALMDNSQQNII